MSKKYVFEILLSCISGRDRDMKFSNELSKEERALVHKISKQYGLKHRSYGKGEDMYLIVSKE